MNKGEMVLSVLELYSEIEQLKAENAELKKEINEGEGDLSIRLKKWALDQLFRTVTYMWNRKVNMAENEDGSYEAEEYEHWRDQYLSKSNIPDCMSLDEVYRLLDGIFREIYEEEKNKAIAGMA